MIDSIGGEYENRTRLHGFAIKLHYYFNLLINMLSIFRMDVYENVYPVFSFYDVFFVTIFGANIKTFNVT